MVRGEEVEKITQIGFIGAGKVGTNLGRYFAYKGLGLSGYYSRRFNAAEDSAKQTNSRAFSSIKEILAVSDWLFITVPDDQLEMIWAEIEPLLIKEHVVFHCSGAKSSHIFKTEKPRISCFSLHPLMAFSSKSMPLEQLEKTAFTIEGTKKLVQVKNQLTVLGNPLAIISAEQKSLYHAACVFASNLVVGLTATTEELFSACGLPETFAKSAWHQLFTQNAENLVLHGTKAALTGPAERNDLTTIKQHLAVLPPDDQEIYRNLTKKIIGIAKEKYPEKNYQAMEREISQ